MFENEIDFKEFSTLSSDVKDCETHYRGEGFLFLSKSIKTQKE
jgi:hypothetical protein